ncbi:MAG TPA: peptidoglycan-binding protein [Pyrinomonadaceae bacterium]|nr:peptidoglycan-binding protein [Pyrinomonadaceae bacterium]
MKISAAELRKRIEQGEDLETISLSLISPAERELLRRCAVVRTFDEELVDTYFRPQVPGADEQTIPFSALTRHEFVQRVPRTEDVYVLLSATRKQYYDSWWESPDHPQISRSEVPESLRKLSESLIKHYAKLGNAGKLDLLAQQAFGDKAKTFDLFDELYKKADSAFDLARCRDIINVLTGRENVLGPKLAQYLNDTDHYLQARSRWATEYYQTVNYYNRKELCDELQSFLRANAKPEPGNKWILHLHAPGGMGKTMFVRWLISRRCVPRPYTIPCGRIDFDFIDRITVSQHRWRLFLNIARDLEEQIPGNYFHSLITRFSEYERILNHQETQQETPTHLPPRDELEDVMLFLFGNALRDAKLDKPVILIFDTLEEVILYHPEDLLEIVRQVSKLRHANVLVILSGRYDLTAKEPGDPQRLPQFNNEFGTVTRTIRVKPFEEKEALKFLQRRGLTKDRPLKIVVERAEGNPFKLALFADLLLDDPEITADTIRSYPSTDLLYLIERVLARIPNKTLHWLLRYGVVPRKLTLSFVKEVIKPHLARAISGDPSQDDPSRYQSLTAKALATVQEKKIFVDSHEQDLDDEQLDKLWTELQNYASTFAWVTMERGDSYTASFHGDVVNPMRRWLEENPVYKLLHQDAVEYFEKKAQTDPDDWAKWMSNAVYHKFQLEGEKAAKYWRYLITHEDDPSRRRELAGEIIGSEYVDENFQPRLLLNGKKIISLATLAEAYYELARACVGMARAQNVPASDQLWLDADYDLAKCEELLGKLSVPVVSRTKLVSVRAAILISQNRSDEAISVLQDALKQTLKESDLVRLETELANAYSAQKDHEKAIFYWESALRRAEHSGRSPRFIVETRRRLARLHRDAHDLNSSALDLKKALEFLPPEDATTRGELLRVLGDLYFEMGDFARARELADDHGLAPSPIANLQTLNQMTKLFLASNQPDKALGLREQTKFTITNVDHSQMTDEYLARFAKLVSQFEEQSGMLKSMLREVEEARIDLETARSRWRELGDSKAVKRCMLKKADLFLTQAGNVSQAQSTLDEASRLTLDYDAEQWLEEMLLRLRIWHLVQAADQWERDRQLVEQRAAKEKWAPTLRARLIIATSSRKLRTAVKEAVNQFFSDLADVLSQIQPASARMILLDPLRVYPRCKDVEYEVVEKVLSLFPLQRSDDDFFIHGPRLAQLMRVLGRKDQAVSLLKHLIDKDLKGNSFAQRGALLTLGRTSLRSQKLSDLLSFFETFTEDYKAFPVLCGSTIVEFAELGFIAQRSIPDRLLSALDQAEELLKTDDHESQWMARLLALRGKLNIKTRQKEALDQLQNAISIHKTLGNSLAAAKLEEFIAAQEIQPHDAGEIAAKSVVPSVKSEPIPQEGDGRLKFTILVEDRWTESITVRTTLPLSIAPITRRVPIEPGSLLDDLLAFDTYENYSFKFLRRMDSDWVNTCRGLADIFTQELIVLDHLISAGKEINKTTLCLILGALQISSAPWELMVLPSHSGPASVSWHMSRFYRSAIRLKDSVAEIVWLQTALSRLGQLDSQNLATDRISSKQTEEAVKKFQYDQGLFPDGRLGAQTRRAIKRALHEKEGRDRPRVLLLQPGIERQRAISRGGDVIGVNLNDLYRRRGFKDLVVIEDPYLELVAQALSDFKPDVVHICPTMEESTSVGIYLDFGSGGTGVMPRRSSAKSAASKSSVASSGEVQFLTLTAVAELMGRQQKQDQARPLLILDVLQPAGQTELFTQLFLRNAFAAQLYQSNAFENIIATGLTPPELQEEVSHTLISGIGNFATVGEIVGHLRHLRDAGSYTHLPKVGDNLGPLRDPSDRNYLSTVVATAGVALFTQDPDM